MAIESVKINIKEQSPILANLFGNPLQRDTPHKYKYITDNENNIEQNSFLYKNTTKSNDLSNKEIKMDKAEQAEAYNRQIKSLTEALEKVNNSINEYKKNNKTSTYTASYQSLIQKRKEYQESINNIENEAENKGISLQDTVDKQLNSNTLTRRRQSDDDFNNKLLLNHTVSAYMVDCKRNEGFKSRHLEAFAQAFCDNNEKREELISKLEEKKNLGFDLHFDKLNDFLNDKLVKKVTNEFIKEFEKNNSLIDNKDNIDEIFKNVHSNDLKKTIISKISESMEIDSSSLIKTLGLQENKRKNTM